uniref:Uncharacterized protein n=1 Tax=Lepeophtheirus salmonis TaxID=72036 RepID=A0A0K2U0W1_LEPSM
MYGYCINISASSKQNKCVFKKQHKKRRRVIIIMTNTTLIIVDRIIPFLLTWN